MHSFDEKKLVRMSKQNPTIINDAENHLDIIHFKSPVSDESCDDYTIITVKRSNMTKVRPFAMFVKLSMRPSYSEIDVWQLRVVANTSLRTCSKL
jgi:hypothetical protein